ncbi:NUT family member 2G-like [Sorex fumeus]|uniref:NUT family member 2G-like n=1 Tax=Sorex fumeus TaxID=62283 RepID=UPI0024AE52A1|nr:NUT family member 2G-like [Sorex fumeus]
MAGGPLPHWVCGESGPANTRNQASPETSSRPSSVYENFRRWQNFKALTRRYLPQTPDTEAVSCFLIPVLRTLARLKPTMSLEEGLRRALREWEGTSYFDRMIYYDMAAKFMEFEAEEEMEAQKLQWMNGVQGLPTTAPPRPEPQGAPGPPLGQRAPKTKAPKEIPPETMQENMDIMDEQLKAPDTVCGAPLGRRAAGMKEQQEEAGTCPDPGLLSYVYELCSQEAFVTKVEAVIHPSFLAHLLSPESQLDLLDLAEELEEEEGIVEKRLQTALDKEVQKSGLATTRNQALPKTSSSPNSVYENFRRWQSFKALTRQYIPQTLDTEALSCFLIPGLRTLACLKPTMGLEEGLRRALREWHGTSNFDRIIYYDVAAK